MRIKLSQSDWRQIGTQMGWLKTALQNPEDAQGGSGDPHQGEYWKHAVYSSEDVKYSLISTEGKPIASGGFRAANPYDILYLLDEKLRDKECDPNGSVNEIVETLVTRDEVKMYKYQALNKDRNTCGYITVVKADGRPFKWRTREEVEESLKGQVDEYGFPPSEYPVGGISGGWGSGPSSGGRLNIKDIDGDMGGRLRGR